jgi:hypothetical protein
MKRIDVDAVNEAAAAAAPDPLLMQGCFLWLLGLLVSVNYNCTPTHQPCGSVCTMYKAGQFT